MAQALTIKAGGKMIKLVASMKAARDICDELCDLLVLRTEQQRSLLIRQMGRQ